ncbi:uncharacterized protein BX663DRAFT_561011 [Cokeromyces recurvatus]|uniref:uncharacterized protein n=1 Tax=Cokeromyces recurvatus TaxID=90255 RepID=UPI00221F4C25|nr:uncharacterized protein BX663DRAFT_561011 [Cokeromyces recurvatus]KAI7902931.1 hypothetical protein BX663DRAFT_561011 [Cokeromyces recurvatus]
MELYITNVDYKRKDPVFWIEVQTNSIKYKHRRIPRYYSELEKLHDYFVSTLDDVLIPALPACPLARFDKRTGELLSRQWWLYIQNEQQKSTTTQSNENALEYKIQLWLNRITQNERVQMSEGLREFVESEVGFRPNMLTVKSSFLARTRSGQVMIHATESDMGPEFRQCLKELNLLHHNLKQVLTQVNKVEQEQRGMTRTYLNLSSAWVSYGGLERSSNLFILYKSIAKGYQQLYDLSKFQELAMNDTLEDEIIYQIKNCESTQNAMQRRLNTLSIYLSSQKYTESSLRSMERLKSSIHIDRDQVTEAIAILEDARINENNCKIRFERINTNLQNDIEAYYKPNSTQDLLKSIKIYAKSQLYLEKKKLLVLENMIKS